MCVMSDKPAGNRPSLQLLIDRDKVRRFRASCITKGTTMSKVVDAFIDDFLAADAAPPPKRRASPPRK